MDGQREYSGGGELKATVMKNPLVFSYALRIDFELCVHFFNQ